MYLGIDVGSVSTDAVLINKDKEVMGYSIVRSGFDHKSAIQTAINEVMGKAKIQRQEIKKIVGTGYGRRNIADVDKTVTEISCHALGIHHFFPHVRMVIDIGGQDSKGIRVTRDGFVEAFIMNDKCAAGTGRFLEVMASTMNVAIDKLGELSLMAEKETTISSICTVFAESEVISRISEGVSMQSIIAGLHKAIGERIVGIVSSIGIVEPIALTGGVAKNIGVIHALGKNLKSELLIPEEPQIIGALGAALFARMHDEESLTQQD
jgi:predicted CoA-substrate-specific enzyme activase